MSVDIYILYVTYAIYAYIQEIKNMNKARKVGVNTPYILFVDLSSRKIYMEDIRNGV